MKGLPHGSTTFATCLARPVTSSEDKTPMILKDLNINDGSFTAEEYEKVKRFLKERKSAEPDKIPPEVLKNCKIYDIILDLFNRALMNEEKPEQWSLANIIPVPKKGDLSKTDNYRGVSLLCIIAKMYNRLILNKLRAAIDPHLRNNQNGFRS